MTAISRGHLKQSMKINLDFEGWETGALIPARAKRCKAATASLVSTRGNVAPEGRLSTPDFVGEQKRPLRVVKKAVQPVWTSLPRHPAST
jgi:hypothetical protein